MTSYTSQALVFGRAFMNTIMAAFAARPAGPLVAAGAKIRLSQDPTFNPTPNSNVAGLSTNEATFSGYTAGGNAVTLSGPVNASPTCQGELASTLFVATASTVTNNVYGYWIDDGVNVIVGERFAGGGIASFNTSGDFLDLQIVLPGQLLQAAA